jgi:hypothetical protein
MPSGSMLFALSGSKPSTPKLSAAPSQLQPLAAAVSAADSPALFLNGLDSRSAAADLTARIGKASSTPERRPFMQIETGPKKGARERNDVQSSFVQNMGFNNSKLCVSVRAVWRVIRCKKYQSTEGRIHARSNFIGSTAQPSTVSVRMSQ